MVFLTRIILEEISTAKSLYKYLIRNCEKLPTPEAQLYYKNFVKQSFKQHSDEVDQDRINQIIKQAIKDCNWILKKGTGTNQIINSHTMEYPVVPNTLDMLDTMDMPCPLTAEFYMDFIHEKQGGSREWHHKCLATRGLPTLAVIKGEVRSKESFFQAASILLTRPNAVNGKVFSAPRELKAIEPAVNYSEHGFGIKSYDSLVELTSYFLRPFTLDTLEFLNEENISKIVCIRSILMKNAKSTVIYEFWDFEKSYIKFVQVDRVLDSPDRPVERSMSTLLTTISCNLVEDKYVATLKLRGSPRDPTDLLWTNHCKSKIFPKFLKWAEEEPVALKCIGSPQLSMQFIPHEEYLIAYNRLKKIYMGPLRQIWLESKESTDASKYISEDLGIASYLLVLQANKELKFGRKFVDLGCGNGLLAYILCAEGWTGIGFDIRRRNIWKFLPNMEEKLKVEDVRHPYFKIKSFADRKTLIIGNHPDELTPWIPIIAKKTKSPFIVIPCCAYDFNGKYEKEKMQGVNSKVSIYKHYIYYIKYIACMCSYDSDEERLRIPSTKRIALIGGYNPELETALCQSSIGLIQLAKFESKLLIAFSNYIDSMKLTSKSIEVKNCTQLPREEISTVVKAIFDLLINKASLEDKFGDCKNWNRGHQFTTLPELVKELGPALMKLLKNQNKGLQTLLRNHKHIFKLEDGMVRLRIPHPSEREKLTQTNPSKLKLKVCYYVLYHPNGCPLLDYDCCFLHWHEFSTGICSTKVAIQD